MPNSSTPIDLARTLHDLRPQRTMLSDDVYEAIKLLVMDHVIPPGERVGIEFLARELAVSPTPIREALARLEAEDLVTKEPLKGYRVAPLLTRDETDGLFQMRLLIEPWAASQAAAHATDVTRSAIEAEMAAQPPIPTGVRYAEYGQLTAHDERFHGLIAASTQNAFVEAAFRGLHVHLHLFRLYYGQTLGDTVPGEHSLITEAILNADADAAGAAMEAHIEASRHRILAAFDAGLVGQTIATDPAETSRPRTNQEEANS